MVAVQIRSLGRHHGHHGRNTLNYGVSSKGLAAMDENVVPT